MDRRMFLETMVGGLLTVPRVGEARPAGQRPRIGYLASGARRSHHIETFLGRLRELGYEQGKNLEFESRSRRMRITSNS